MENIDSPTKPIPLNLSVRSMERNVLKELNNLEGATKSPKQAIDHPENYTKDPINLSKIVPDIDTKVDADNFKAVNRNLLHVTTPTDVQSSDDEYADCNTTFKSSVSSPVKNTFDATSVLNKTVEILEKENPTSPNESNDANVTVCVSNQKLNLGFIENGRSEVGDLETVQSAGDGESVTENRSKDTPFSSSFTHDAAATDQNSTVLIHQCIDEPSNKSLEVTADLLKGEKEEVEVPVISSECTIESESVTTIESANVTTIESEPAIELKTATPKSEHENNSYSDDEQRTEPQIIVESNPIIESESVVEPDTVSEPQPVNESEPAEKPLDNETETIIQSESVSEFEPVIESTPAVTVNELSTPTCGSQGNVSFDVPENVLQTTDQELSNLNETRTLPEATSSCQQDATFISKSDVNNETVLVESSPTKSHDKLGSEENTRATDPEGLIDGTQLQKIREFKANQAVSADSLELDGETRDCSLDSLEMKPNEPSTPTDKCPPIDTAEKLFSSRKAPNFSEMFPNSNFTTDGSNDFILNKRWDDKSADLTNEEFGMQPSVDGDFNSSERVIRQDTFDITTPVGDNFEYPETKNLNASYSTLCRQETFSVPSSPCANDSSSVTDLTALLNKVAINSPGDKIDSNDRLKRSGTFEILSVDGSNKRTKLSSDAELNECELESNTPSVSMSIPSISEKEQLPSMVLNSNDFDFLQSRGAKSIDPEEDRRSSLLLRFDPLSERITPKIQLPPTVEVVEAAAVIEESFQATDPVSANNSSVENHCSEQQSSHATNASEMSVSLVHDSNNMDNETNSYVNSIKTNDEKHIGGDVPLNDKKIKLEYADGNIRKKMEEYEATQEILVKRLQEKDKTLSKNCAIIEAYEKALAELVAEKEKLTENYEVVNEKLRQERDIHHQHLMSLENTFSDLHKKYERSKEFAMQLQERLDFLSEEKAKIDELLKRQESRYEKMKQHALHQLEYANSTLEDQEKNNGRENSRLKALLKIEEVSRNTIQEQLLQKCKENEELVKICDELIGGQKS